MADPSPPAKGYWLPRRWSETPEPAQTTDGTASLPGSLHALFQAVLDALSNSDENHDAALGGLRDAVERLEKQQSRAGKEQFKANALAETQQRSLATLVEQLKDAEAHRDREVAEIRERLSRARVDGRLDLVKSLLPTLDGLEEALAAGRRMLDAAWSASLSHTAEPMGRQTLGARWRRAVQILVGKAGPVAASSSIGAPPEAVDAWLEGLRLIRDRLLQVLAAEGISPIRASGEAFDPRLHRAVEAVPAENGAAPGYIVREARRGYMIGDSVLRYAEVVVARDEDRPGELR